MRILKCVISYLINLQRNDLGHDLGERFKSEIALGKTDPVLSGSLYLSPSLSVSRSHYLFFAVIYAIILILIQL